MIRFIRSKSGSVSILVALVLPVLFSIAAFSVDLGNAYYVKSKIQLAADSAALGAVLSVSNQSSVAPTALKIVTENTPGSFGSLSTSADVTIGAWNATTKAFTPTTNSPNAVQVRTHRTVANGNPLTTYFGGFVGIHQIDVNAVAVAIYYGGNCVIVLDPSSAAVSLSGSSSINMNCPLQVNSSSGTATNTQGSSSIKASKICIVGGYAGSNYSPTPKVGCPVAADPFANLPEPARPSCSYTNVTYLSNANCAYVGGTISASGSIPGGTYYLSGANLNIGSNTSISGNNITFFLDSTSTLSMGGSSSAINLTAPVTGAYAGILVFQSRSAPLANGSINLNGSSSLSLQGVLYAPQANLTLKGSSGLSGSTGKVIVNQITAGGSSSFNLAVPYSGEASLRSLRAHASLVK